MKNFAIVPFLLVIVYILAIAINKNLLLEFKIVTGIILVLINMVIVMFQSKKSVGFQVVLFGVVSILLPLLFYYLTV